MHIYEIFNEQHLKDESLDWRCRISFLFFIYNREIMGRFPWQMLALSECFLVYVIYNARQMCYWSFVDQL